MHDAINRERFPRMECGTDLPPVGGRLYNYYDMVEGTLLTEPDDQGWFYFQPATGGQRTVLNGERVCSMEFAARRGFPLKADKQPL